MPAPTVQPDPDLLASPLFLLAAWAAGLAVAGGLVAWWKVVGPGFSWMVAATVAVLAGVASAAGMGSPAVLALGGAVVAGAGARRRWLAVAGFAVAAAGALTAAAGIAGWPLAATGAAALGGITGEMLLGHWYLVDPTLPRWALRRLDIVGVAGLVADIAALALFGPSSPFGAGAAAVAALAVLAAMSVLLMVMVWFALDHPAYSGVMAATGLSYLAVLTGLGAVYLGRLLASGQAPAFLSF